MTNFLKRKYKYVVRWNHVRHGESHLGEELPMSYEEQRAEQDSYHDYWGD